MPKAIIYAVFKCTEHPEWETESTSEAQNHLLDHVDEAIDKAFGKNT